MIRLKLSEYKRKSYMYKLMTTVARKFNVTGVHQRGCESEVMLLSSLYMCSL